uniref:Uncharacterized protein n=1 Tax=Oryza glumipatula TaxID=40148 RepID=A0A0E0B3U5_9ORYZ
MSSGVDSGGCGHRRRAVAWCGTWMVEDAVTGNELRRGVGVWTAEDAAAGDKLRHGAWAVEDVATGNELWRSVRRGKRRALQVGDKVPAWRGPSMAKDVATSDELRRGVSSMKPAGIMIVAMILSVLMVLLLFTDFSCLSPRSLDFAFSACCPPIGIKFIDASFSTKS